MNIVSLNKTQQLVLECWGNRDDDIIVYSPTGSGKTISFVIPILLSLNGESNCVEAVVITPSRELALQVFHVIKTINPETRVACCYGGHKSADEINTLKSNPNVIIATPGRLLDHIKRGNVDLSNAKCLVLDEFDKSLELGFTDEMKSIMKHCPTQSRQILTSATRIKEIPAFVNLKHPYEINNLDDKNLFVDSRITLWKVKSHSSSKLDTLLELLFTIPDEKTIIFSNSRDTAQFLYEKLSRKNISLTLYHGAMEQKEREKAVAMFNNGSALVISATDLAARGLDIADIKHIVHYDLPLSQEVFTHRNGRTARVDATGDVYLIIEREESLPDYARDAQEFNLDSTVKNHKQSRIGTIHINAGKKEKVSRGDIVGFLATNTSVVNPSEIGVIDVFNHYSLVAVPRHKTDEIIKSVSPFKLKKQKVKLSKALVQLKFTR